MSATVFFSPWPRAVRAGNEVVGAGRATVAASTPLHQRLEALYAAHFDFVWRSARRLGVLPAQLDDVVQETFLVAYRRLAEFEGRSSERTWLFGIVLRVAKTHRRSLGRKAAEPLLLDVRDDRAGADEALEAGQARAVLEHLLGALDEDRRAVFILAELEEMTAPEIASALGVKLNTVYSRLRLARKDFEDALKRYRAQTERVRS